MDDVGSNARRFLDAFHKTEIMLQSRFDRRDGKRPPFNRLIDESDELVGEQKSRLKELALLRNAIVHTPYSPRDEPYADPRNSVVEWIEKQADVIENPPLVIGVLKLDPPRVLQHSDDVSRFLAEVAYPFDFSQAPVRDANGQIFLVTTNAVARWVASAYSPHAGGVLPLASIAEVARFSEEGDRLHIASERLRVIDALRIFGGALGVPPAAILMRSESPGDPDPLGLCVRSDLPELLRALGVGPHASPL
ncbi:hypothetical protein [Mycetocola manganoxydans]|uniref:hypothetical protein n=1 Tax=Mycetocola manganoxydans TaxID=699879 RepID=UPI0011C4100C|nr:hypothetical protein [Mycetocola manganoxydans]